MLNPSIWKKYMNYEIPPFSLTTTQWNSQGKIPSHCLKWKTKCTILSHLLGVYISCFYVCVLFYSLLMYCLWLSTSALISTYMYFGEHNRHLHIHWAVNHHIVTPCCEHLFRMQMNVCTVVCCGVLLLLLFIRFRPCSEHHHSITIFCKQVLCFVLLDLGEFCIYIIELEIHILLCKGYRKKPMQR